MTPLLGWTMLVVYAAIAPAADAPGVGDYRKLYDFPASSVEILGGPLQKARETNRRYLLELDPDRLLYSFRVNAGLPAPGSAYGGWENEHSDIRGHFTGHYLSALALMYAGTGDEIMLQRGRYMVAELAKCQEALGGKYLSAFPDSFLDRIEQQKNPPPATYYTLHKIMAGLYDQYTFCDNPQALQILEGMADYFIQRTEAFTPEQLNAILDHTEEGGTDETFWNLYAATGKEKYRLLADKYEKKSFLTPLAQNEDNLNHRHGNTHIPLVVGAIRRYEITGESRYLGLAQYFWDRVIHTRSFASGGTTNAEVWGEPYHLANTLSRTNHETCKTYNLLRLTRHLLECTGDAAYGDYYERAFINGIWGTQEPESGLLEYYVPMASGYQRVFGSHDTTFWCCTGTGVETWSKVSDSIYFHDDDTLYVNLFTPSRVRWKARGVTLRQDTEFPEKETTLFTVEAAPADAWALALRLPAWAAPGYDLSVNNEAVAVTTDARGWCMLRRAWKPGDMVKLSLPMRLHTEPMPDDPNLVAFLYGPVVLAGITDGVADRAPVIADDPARPQPEADAARRGWYFTAESTRDLGWLQPVPDKPLCFQTQDQPFAMSFQPLYRVSGQRYGLYFPLIPKGSDREALLEKEDRALQFLHKAEALPAESDLPAVEAEYQAILQEPGLKAYQDRALTTMAHIYHALGKADKAREIMAPLTEPLARREYESILREILPAPVDPAAAVTPFICTAEAGDASFNKVVVDQKPALKTLPEENKRFIYAALPSDSPWRGVQGAYTLRLSVYADGRAGSKVVVEYNGEKSPYTAVAAELPTQPGWTELTLLCPDASFSGRQNLNADFRLRPPIIRPSS